MHPFDYQRPATLAEARDMLAASGDGKLLAGGMTLIPTMKMRLAQPATLVDLGGIRGLRQLRLDGDVLEIGALATHSCVAASHEVRSHWRALAELAGRIGDPQVRNRGTIGGSIANSDPAADYPAAVLALGATVVTDRREIAADEFFQGMFETALDEDEIVVALRFPRPARAAYAKFPNPASRYAMAGVFVAETSAGIRVGVTGAAGCAFRWTSLEDALAASFDAGSAASVPLDDSEFMSDIHGSAGYRAQLVRVMARRAIETCA